MYCFYLLFCAVHFMYVSVLGAKKLKNMELNELITISPKKESSLKEHIFHFQFQRQT